MTPTLKIAKLNQTIRVLRREITRLNTTNSILEARCARLELEARFAAEDAAGASL